MAASKDTVADVYWTLCRHLSRAKITAVLDDLVEVKGNKSFMTTVAFLRRVHKAALEQELAELRELGRKAKDAL